ncbi:hypothetical protein NW754_010247 [Fusarium falciforme]|nr:hypothetical protein NW754_010247 [Fusarium falciforme]
MAEFLYSRSEDLWWKAVASLKPELRELFSDEGVDKRGALEVLLYQARRQREVCIRKQWRITKKSGDVIILRDVFEKIIQCVDKFKMLGNAAAEFAPGYASVPWAVIKMLLQATFDPAKEIEDALKRVNSKQKEVERTAQIANMEIMYGTSARVHDLTAMVSSLSAQLETANASIANLSINATNGEATTSRQGQLNIESIMGLILKTLADNPATIIIDALDELRADRRHEIFEYLDQIVKQSPNVVKVLLTSRNDGDIVCRLDTTPNVYISAQENRGDIERFIDAELDKAITQKRLLRGHVSADVQRQITFELNHRADGM